MRLNLIIAGVAVLGLAGCLETPMNVGSSSAKTVATGSAGGANANDVFGFTGSGSTGVNVSGGNLRIGTTDVGTFTNTGGTLSITFNTAATAAPGALPPRSPAAPAAPAAPDSPPPPLPVAAAPEAAAALPGKAAAFS